jgi:hypothetical protein
MLGVRLCSQAACRVKKCSKWGATMAHHRDSSGAFAYNAPAGTAVARPLSLEPHATKRMHGVKVYAS